MHRLLAALSLLFLLPSAVRASGPYVSEIAWAGSSASLADEWLEICAAPGTALSFWTIEGASSAPIALPEGSVVGPSGTFLVANYAADDARSTLAALPDLVTTALALSNSALAVTLRDATSSVADAAGDGGAPPAGASGEAKASMERAGPAAAWATATATVGFDAGAPERGTPGSCGDGPAAAPETPTGSATATPEEAVPGPSSPPEPPMGAVRISEIFPSPPSGGREWVELVNPSNVGEFLDGWTIEDAAGTRTRLDGLLLPWGRRLIESPKGSLNNDGDAVTLRDALGRAVDAVAYGKIAKGHAVMRVEFGADFLVTRTPTPEGPNVFTDEHEATPAPEPRSAPTESAAAAAAAPTIPAPAAPQEPVAKPVTTSAAKPIAPVAAPKPKAPKPAAPKYKGATYVATVAVPPGAYSKTRAYVLVGGGIEELRFSKSPAASWDSGDRIAFVAQEKSEGAVAFLLANPNSVRTIGSASATFATVTAWPGEPGGYRFVAEVTGTRGNAIEVRLGGGDGDVLAPAGVASALRPGDLVRVEGFVAPGPRPRVFLPHARAIALERPRAGASAAAPKERLPTAYAAGLTLAAAAIGLAAYLRAWRLKRLALAQSPIVEGAWE